jgi:hypothetical protein
VSEFARAITIIEAMLVVVILAVAVPPSLRMMDETAAAKADAITIHRCASLLSAVLETAAADAASTDPSLGSEVFENVGAYLDTPATGLLDRLADEIAVYTDVGIDLDVAVSVLLAADGSVTGDPALDVYRRITATATANSARGGRFEVPVSVVVGGP